MRITWQTKSNLAQQHLRYVAKSLANAAAMMRA